MKKFLVFFMVAFLLLTCALPTFASDILPIDVDDLGREVPDIYEVWDRDKYSYAILWDDGRHLFLSESRPRYWINPQGFDYIHVASGKYQSYENINGLWSESVSGTSGYNLSAYSDGILLVDWTSSDILNLDGSVWFAHDPDFFPIPLWTTIQKVTQGKLEEETVPTMASTMNTLVLCGVGLMACLVVLSLFGKRSLIFRG